MSDLLNAFFSQSHYANLDQGGSSSGGSGSGSSTNTRLQQQQLYIQNYLMNLGSNELENTESKAFKKMLYQLMIHQLVHDGFIGAANYVADATMTPPSTSLQATPDRLSELVLFGLQAEKAKQQDLQITEGGVDYDMRDSSSSSSSSAGSTLDDERNLSFDTRFITTHKGPCRTAKFTLDGKFVVTGSSDCSLKLLDVEKMHSHHQTKAEVENITEARPVIRTFYDHTDAINDVDIHPTLPVVVSASADCTVKFFDYTKTSVKKSFKQINETHNVRTIHMHPSGDYMLMGTDHNQVRIYDLNNMQCYTSPNLQDHHFGPINQVRFSSDGKLYVSGSKDGAIKIWDGVTGRCVNTIPNAHSGQVYSVQFSLNGKYMLSNGQDFVAKLWDLSTGRQVRTYASSKKSLKSDMSHSHSSDSKLERIQTCFNFNETSVLTSEGNDVVIWDTRQARIIHRLGGHNKNVRWVAPSPVEHAFMSCSEDQRARFWAADRNA